MAQLEVIAFRVCPTLYHSKLDTVSSWLGGNFALREGLLRLALQLLAARGSKKITNLTGSSFGFS